MMPAPCFRSAREQPVDFRLGADIDADRRLVEDEQLGAVVQPLADDDLLLVAARQARRQRAARLGVLMLQIADLPVGVRRFLARPRSASRASGARRSAG